MNSVFTEFEYSNGKINELEGKMAEDRIATSLGNVDNINVNFLNIGY